MLNDHSVYKILPAHSLFFLEHLHVGSVLHQEIPLTDIFLAFDQSLALYPIYLFQLVSIISRSSLPKTSCSIQRTSLPRMVASSPDRFATPKVTSCRRLYEPEALAQTRELIKGFELSGNEHYRPGITISRHSDFPYCRKSHLNPYCHSIPWLSDGNSAGLEDKYVCMLCKASIALPSTTSSTA